MLQWEKTCGLLGEILMQEMHNVEYTEHNNKVDLRCRKFASIKTNLNFKGGNTARYVSTTIMSEVDSI